MTVSYAMKLAVYQANAKQQGESPMALSAEQLRQDTGIFMDRYLRSPGRRGFPAHYAIPILPADFRRWLTTSDPVHLSALDWCRTRGITLGINGVRKLTNALAEFLT